MIAIVGGMTCLRRTATKKVGIELSIIGGGSKASPKSVIGEADDPDDIEGGEMLKE